MKLIILIANSFPDAEAAMAGRVLSAGVETRWFPTQDIAIDWLNRCEARGLKPDAVWRLIDTPKRRRAA